jgi:cyclopropane fatty-acyl-phospholipid synthase-like methyltransferase
MTGEQYDEEYFERGVETHKSGYTNYTWKPEYVLPLANQIKQKFKLGENSTVLDFGCAKGYLVHALNLLGVPALGYDISKYAEEHAITDYVVTNELPTSYCDLIIAKDVLEHIPKDELVVTLQKLRQRLMAHGRIFVVVPLGDNGKFRIREYEMDVTHVNKEDELWWHTQFIKGGLGVEEFYYQYPGVKENWTSKHPYGNGVFILRRI